MLRKMAIPGVISQILLLLYNMVDRIYLGRLNDGGTALLAVGLCLPVTYVFNAVAFLFGQGGAARAMIKLGSGKRDEAESIMGNSGVSIVISGVILEHGHSLFCYAYLSFTRRPQVGPCCGHGAEMGTWSVWTGKAATGQTSGSRGAGRRDTPSKCRTVRNDEGVSVTVLIRLAGSSLLNPSHTVRLFRS